MLMVDEQREELCGLSVEATRLPSLDYVIVYGPAGKL
jgi:hypothetical protein